MNYEWELFTVYCLPFTVYCLPFTDYGLPITIYQLLLPDFRDHFICNVF